MAYVGLRKPIIAKLLESGKYDKPFACGKAIGLQVNPNYAEGSLNADDKQAEYDKEFTYAEVTLNISTLPIEAHEKMFGHTVDTAKKNVKFNVDDQANYVGMAWVSVEKVDGVRSFIGNFLNHQKIIQLKEIPLNIKHRLFQEERLDWKTDHGKKQRLAAQKQMR